MTTFIIGWTIIFILSLAALVKGSHWFLHGAERIGLNLGMRPFVIGVLIIGVGTSFPEFIAAIAAVLGNVPEVVVSNAVGSNIANILLVIGVAAVIGRKLEVTRDLVDLELPLLAISTVLFLGIIFDGVVLPLEALMLFSAYLIYLVYSLFSQEEGEAASTVVEYQAGRIEQMAEEHFGLSRVLYEVKKRKEHILFVVGIILVLGGAKYLIDSVIALSRILDIAPGVISITAIAFGTSLPELFVAGRAVLEGKSEVAVGNVLGSNAFNALMVVGIPGLFAVLPVDESTLAIGIPIMALTTLLFIISGISKRLYHWEGMMFIILYLFFLFKLFGVV